MWSIRLRVDSPNSKSLASALSTEHDVSLDGNSFTMVIEESRAKDARAIWNTRMRSLVMSSNMIEVMDSSTSNV